MRDELRSVGRAALLHEPEPYVEIRVVVVAAVQRSLVDFEQPLQSPPPLHLVQAHLVVEQQQVPPPLPQQLDSAVG
jgi:hypothetical protein